MTARQTLGCINKNAQYFHDNSNCSYIYIYILYIYFFLFFFLNQRNNKYIAFYQKKIKIIDTISNKMIDRVNEQDPSSAVAAIN